MLRLAESVVAKGWCGGHKKNESGGRRDSLIGLGSLSRYQLGNVSLR